MKKDNIRDYATNAFRLYAYFGRPSTEYFKSQIIDDAIGNETNKSKISIVAKEAEEKSLPLIKDIEAVNKTISILEARHSTDIINAIEGVYFILPNEKIKQNDITARAQAVAVSNFSDIRTVFRNLKEARKIFAEARGLNIESCQ